MITDDKHQRLATATRRPCPTARRFAMVRTLYRNATNDCALALADKAAAAWWPGLRCKGGRVPRYVPRNVKI